MSKIFKVINRMFLPTRIILKLTFSIILIIAISFIFILIYGGRYKVILVILGLFILAEIAHFIRKSREKVMVKRATKENEKNSFSRDLFKPEKSKNKNLLNLDKSKNEDLLDLRKS